ncbi:acyltransferase family protein [Paenibacillus crassostreae]|uniref:Acyltransferase 3 domain-containing protein n=1 Tax=Paenibacillus crassostreae TaxID=1763538 RepID=A0A167E207_9BACL|nr:acyltransferase family protein [Paenibacillus crassostreae]AOZ93316.1 hypothetical protein LPB68_14580 [Paenibacillus crassostreae]OAB75038.1 hypothetical protein PNBC_09355 [Paenibacillus crassostreae]
MGKYNWLYQIRGMAIIAVVVCHQQGLLHSSEWIQLLTLYSVTIFIFCAGVTQAFSLKKLNSSFITNERYSFSEYIINRLKPIILSYIVVTIAYLSQRNMWTGLEWDMLFNALLTFSASPPLYFLRYFIVLICVAPILFAFVNIILKKNSSGVVTNLKIIILLILTFLIGYYSIGKLDSLGQSYLFVYTAGIIFGSLPFPKVKNVQLPFIITTLMFGLWSTKEFYWARVAGNFNYAEGIDSLVPKLQMNPPNLSIIIYSAGCFFLFYWCFKKVEIHQDRIPVFVLYPFKALTLMGKYSLDIFLWHLFVQTFLTSFEINLLPNIWVKRIVYYSAMFFIPVIFRILYEKLKNYIYDNYKK